MNCFRSGRVDAPETERELATVLARLDQLNKSGALSEHVANVLKRQVRNRFEAGRKSDAAPEGGLLAGAGK